MSKYRESPLDFSALSTIPLADRGGKVRIEHMAAPHRRGASLGE
ncbi:MAG: hypothetical protein ACPL7M_05355 [Bryobacteraceae bacterium]